VKQHLIRGEPEKIGQLLNANFDRRKKIYKISDENLRMVETARSAGVSAKFTGSGGAIVGTYPDQRTFIRLKKKLRQMKVQLIKPKIVSNRKGST